MAEVLPLEPRSGLDLEKIRHRLFEAAADLKLGPVPGPGDILERLHAVGQELDMIRDALRLVIHLAELEESDFEARIRQVNQDLAAGWKPDSAPAGEVIDRLRRAMPH